MYTQCPECGEAFRITADVLKQAAGKVRCGGCGNAFNALEHLSEAAPERRSGKANAERDAALLETVDQLVGPEEVRIEDTGVEWRVLDAEDAQGIESPEEPRAGQEDDEVPDLIADTGMLRFLPAGGDEEDGVDELLEESPTPVDEELTAAPGTVDAPEVFDEMRFDDNTPLPEDFEAREDSERPPEPPVLAEPEVVRDRDDPQVDLAFGEPDEWQDLLGEVVETGAEAAPAAEEPVETPEPPETEEEPSADDLVVLEAAAAAEPGQAPPDVDTQFAMQAEAMGIDLSGTHEVIDEELAEATQACEEEADTETSIDEDLMAAAFETEAAARAAGDDVGRDDADDGGLALADEDGVGANIAVEEVAETEPTPEDETAETEPAPEDEPGDAGLTLQDEADVGRVAGYDIPEMSEEEMTINLLIDQDLLSVAVEDEDGFASTIVQKQPDRKVETELEDLKTQKEESKPLVETIIMEGDDFRNAPWEDELDAGAPNPAPELGFAARARDTMRSVMAADHDADSAPRRRGMISAVVVLTLLLLAQVVHQSREAFATIPAFNRTVGPLYRMLGKPLAPAWDIKGWRFEATKGSTDDTGERLTIYTRVGNKSDQALPYPLLHVSLTDRFEEIIGSRVLEPGEYLAAGADPRKPVPAGNTFDAVVTIDTPAPEATGFKLNVCYRLASGRLRCAVEDFK
jgi:predicted Zn finger-like uncharacterized protein